MQNIVDSILREATLLERASRFLDATNAYKKLLAIDPNHPDSWYNLAALQKKLGQFDEALSSYQQALDRSVTQPEEVHLNRGVIFSDCLRQDEAAERELKTALKLNPNYVPALLNLANLCEDLGRRNDALSLYEKLLAIDPQCHEALARYVSLRGINSVDDPLVASVEKAITNAGVHALDKASLGFALGKALDGCGAYEQAFTAYVAANNDSRTAAGITTQSKRYNRQAHERFIDQLIETFTHDRFNVAETQDTLATPIFICGMFRSGSTLAEQVLAGHSRMQAGGEIDFIPSLVQAELSPFPAQMAKLNQQQLERFAARYRERLATLFPRAEFITDKRPDNFLYIGLIKSLFPNAKIIHTTREPLDNCLSVYFLHLSHNMGYALDLMDIGHYYGQYRRLMTHWKLLYSNEIFEFDYDNFVHEPRPAVEKLLDFCNLGFEEKCLSFQHATNAVKTASVWQVREALYQRSSGRWRHYERNLEPLRQYLDEQLSHSQKT